MVTGLPSTFNFQSPTKSPSAQRIPHTPSHFPAELAESFSRMSVTPRGRDSRSNFRPRSSSSPSPSPAPRKLKAYQKKLPPMDSPPPIAKMFMETKAAAAERKAAKLSKGKSSGATKEGKLSKKTKDRDVEKEKPKKSSKRKRVRYTISACCVAILIVHIHSGFQSC
jgi:hypothetical protein